MKLDIQLFGGRGATSSDTKGYSYAVRENSKYKKELGKSRYAVQFDDRTGERRMSVIDFNAEGRTDNKEKSLHSLDAYENMKIYQRTGASDIYLLTEKQMNTINKRMPTRGEYEANRERTIDRIEKLVSQYADKTIKRRRK